MASLASTPRDPPDPPPASERAAVARALAERCATAAAEGRLDEAREGFERALADGGADVRVLFLCFQFHLRSGEYPAAVEFARRRLAAADPDVDSPLSARAQTNLGLALHFCGDATAAEAAITRALEINRRLGNEYGVARDLGNLSLLPEARGDFDVAVALLHEALAIAERIGADDIAATKLTNLGEIALARGEVDAARNFWSRAVTIFERIGPRKHYDEFSRRLTDLDSAPIR